MNGDLFCCEVNGIEWDGKCFFVFNINEDISDDAFFGFDDEIFHGSNFLA